MYHKDTKVGIIGDGGWGTTLALVLAAKGYSVSLWGAFPAYVDEIRRKRENVKFLPGFKIPENGDASNAVSNKIGTFVRYSYYFAKHRKPCRQVRLCCFGKCRHFYREALLFQFFFRVWIPAIIWIPVPAVDDNNSFHDVSDYTLNFAISVKISQW